MDVVPAYGRTYKNGSEVLHDWNAGKDFKIVAGPYINKSDADNHAALGVRNPYPIEVYFLTPLGVQRRTVIEK